MLIQKISARIKPYIFVTVMAASMSPLVLNAKNDRFEKEPENQIENEIDKNEERNGITLWGLLPAIGLIGIKLLGDGIERIELKQEQKELEKNSKQ